jgi:hypothetical protein
MIIMNLGFEIWINRSKVSLRSRYIDMEGGMHICGLYSSEVTFFTLGIWVSFWGCFCWVWRVFIYWRIWRWTVFFWGDLLPDAFVFIRLDSIRWTGRRIVILMRPIAMIFCRCYCLVIGRCYCGIEWVRVGSFWGSLVIYFCQGYWWTFSWVNCSLFLRVYCYWDAFWSSRRTWWW